MINFIALISAFVALSTVIILLSLMYHAIRYAPFVPTEKKVVRKMVKLADLQKDQEVYDLGCGDGRILHVAREEQDVQARGVEVSRMVALLARIKSWMLSKDIQIIRKNFFDVDLKNADVVFCYLFPRIMKQLQEKFERELKPGAKVISYCFPIKDWEAAKVVQSREDKPENFLIYRYEIPHAYE